MKKIVTGIVGWMFWAFLMWAGYKMLVIGWPMMLPFVGGAFGFLLVVVSFLLMTAMAYGLIMKFTKK